MNMIEVQNLTKDYENNRGIFGLSFTIGEGEVLGFLGSNGAGKTTTIRHLMGFIKPNYGTVKVFGKDAFFDAAHIQEKVGYLPGEISFLDGNMTGMEFIQFMVNIRENVCQHRVKELTHYFALDSKIKIKKMSKGTKQKLGLIIAFMHDAPVLILDEPTSGLDPIMQGKFVELIKKEKQKGKTIFMSSHMFGEIEHTCDRVLMVKEGRLAAEQTIEEIVNNKQKHYTLLFANADEAIRFSKSYPMSSCEENKVSFMQRGNVNQVICELSSYDVKDLTVRNQTIEEVFLQYYGGEEND